MAHFPTIPARAARASTAALTCMLVLAASAGAQGATTGGTVSPDGATGASAHPHPGAGGARDGEGAAGGTHGAASRKAAGPKREGDLGRAPFGTGSRRHDASAAGTPSAKPNGDADGAAGTR